MTRYTTPTTPLTVRGKLADPSLWHQGGAEIHLGCSECVERGLCGGLSVGAPIHNCLDLCCRQPDSCRRYACPMNLERYSRLVNEVGGLELRAFRGHVARPLALPDYVPCILDAGSLLGPLHIPAVAISLYSVVDKVTGLAKFSSRQELLARFKIHGDAKLVLTASAEDRHVEPFWAALRPKRTAESLKRLRPALLTTPNFSMHADTVRHDNLVSMARIAVCVEDFASAGLPVAVHINARTPHDYERWAAYLNDSPNLSTIAYEMATMGRSAVRRAWHAQQLVALAQQVTRPLVLVIRGGAGHLSTFASVFQRVLLLDTTANMKAKMRQRGTRSQAVLHWSAAPSEPGQPIDDLLMHNIRVCQRAMPSHRRMAWPVRVQNSGAFG